MQPPVAGATKSSNRRLNLRRATPILVLGSVLLVLNAQQAPRSAPEALQHGLHLADLYNWADAAKDFDEAEQMFVAAGDQRNALYARFGRIRSTIEHRSLPATSADLDTELNSNSLLQNDKQLRMFCLIVKGDIDGEFDSGAMRRDWEHVQALAKELGDRKWRYRSLAQLGLAAFYDGDLPTATKNVSSALIEATENGDSGARIRLLSTIGLGLVQSKMYDQALSYFQKALAIANSTPEAGYQFLAHEGRLESLIALGQLDAGQRLADDMLSYARQNDRPGHEADVLILASRIALARRDKGAALSALEQSLTVAQAAGLGRQIPEAQSQIAEIYRDQGDLMKAERFAELAAASTQNSGDAWAVPRRLQTLAEIQISQGKYADADRVFDRAGAFIDGMIGNYSGVFEKTALIRASSDLYARHFSLIAEKFKDSERAYAIVEQVRGRVLTDLLLAGSVTSNAARENERTLSQLRLRLMAARSTNEVLRIRDQIVILEQSRWTAPGVSILKSRSHNRVALSTIQHSLSSSALVLEYVLSDPRSYCLVISRTGARIVPLEAKPRIEALALGYLKAVKAKLPAQAESSRLYDVLLRPISEIAQRKTLVIVRDGRLHLLPFDALKDGLGQYVAETHTVVYAPSSSSFYLLSTQRRHRSDRHALLAIGGVPYGPNELKQVGHHTDALSDLPASKDEVLAAQAAFQGRKNTLLLGPNATESAFKRAALSDYRLVHLAVHGFADKTNPDRAGLILLSDPAAGEDGILHASEIVQLRVTADTVVLSACDTAVGPVEGEEGIATLSRAFLLAGAKTVVSTLWSTDDTFSLFLMKQFYRHLAAQESPAYALAAAKREMLQKYGDKAVPYYWAGFTFEGAAEQAIIPYDEKHSNHVTETASASRDSRIH